MGKKFFGFGFVSVLTACLLIGWKRQTEPLVYYMTPCEKMDITDILEMEEFGEKEYRILFFQTGLSRRAIEKLSDAQRNEILTAAQEAFFSVPQIQCTRSSPLSWEEQNVSECLPEFAGLEEGDILISFCSHILGWRNGHAAILVDAENGITLEAVMLGEDACLQSLYKWQTYPSFLVLRLKGQPLPVRREIAQYAYQNMQGLPYGFAQDFLEHFGIRLQKEDTDCSHLIWKAYMEFGFDLDSNGGLLVTPKDLSESPLLEIVQVYGINFDKIYESD